MRGSHFLACALVVLTISCGDDGSDSNGNGSSSGGTGGGSSSGGTAATTGGTQGTGATNGGDDAAAHDATCRSFCEKFREACDRECGETCSGHVNTYGQYCRAEALTFFDCLHEAEPTDYDCSAGAFRTTVSTCRLESHDLLACNQLEGAKCERRDRRDAECASEDPTRPYGFFCVSSAVPQECERLETSSYCCPTE